ncbi:MAG: thioredoxin family protein, partial [Pseudomonadota bacterium]
MALIRTPEPAIGSPIHDFSLPATDGRTLALADVRGARGTLVMFICNHCPFVKHIAGQLAKLHEDYQPKGVHFVGISSNDITTHPEDSPEAMKGEARAQGYRFPYLYDETQEVAKAYRAACTPDIFVFDHHQKLVYRGQLDDSRPRNDKPVT